MTDELKLKISLLPDLPGVYIYRNSEGEVIYVGKAKKLKRRVSSYFNRVHPNPRTNILVRHIADVEHIVVPTEEDALDLENSLIKKYTPRYNVLLKDDKTYPWICVTKEMYPRVFMTREKVNRGAYFYGPYPKIEIARALMQVIRELYPIRTCRLHISNDSIEQKKHRLCLQYHIKNCEGCCQGLVSEDQYLSYIADIRHILNGDTQRVCDYLIEQMQALAADLRFEEAQQLKLKYQLLEKYRAKSVIVNPSIHNIDVFSLLRDHRSAYFNFMHIRRGTVVRSLTLEYSVGTNSELTDNQILADAISEVYDRFAESYRSQKVTQAYCNILPDGDFQDMEFIVPQRGDKKKLLQMSLQNAEQYKQEKYKRQEKLNPEQRVTRLLMRIQTDLHLPNLPRHIESFDNSNISGAFPVSSCVVFRNGKPAKRDYRLYNIKTVEGIDDFASMREVLNRRYTRLLAEGGDLPQLIVVDGGKGQLSAAVEVLEELGLTDSIVAVGLAKRLDEVYFPGDTFPMYIDKNSETLRVLQQLRDEAHRFGITHHRNRRSKGQVHSTLDAVPGVGEKTKLLLLRHFKSLKRIREASEADLANVVGASKAKTIHKFFETNML